MNRSEGRLSGRGTVAEQTDAAPAAETAVRPDAIEVVVRYFGRAREVVGSTEERRTIPAGSSVAHAAEALARAHPALAPHLESCSFAINERYARGDERLERGDELAVIPPIGGG